MGYLCNDCCNYMNELCGTQKDTLQKSAEQTLSKNKTRQNVDSLAASQFLSLIYFVINSSLFFCSKLQMTQVF